MGLAASLQAPSLIPVHFRNTFDRLEVGWAADPPKPPPRQTSSPYVTIEIVHRLSQPGYTAIAIFEALQPPFTAPIHSPSRASRLRRPPPFTPHSRPIHTFNAHLHSYSIHRPSTRAARSSFTGGATSCHSDSKCSGTNLMCGGANLTALGGEAEGGVGRAPARVQRDERVAAAVVPLDPVHLRSLRALEVGNRETSASQPPRYPSILRA